jgi:hypothetical protein
VLKLIPLPLEFTYGCIFRPDILLLGIYKCLLYILVGCATMVYLKIGDKMIIRLFRVEGALQYEVEFIGELDYEKAKNEVASTIKVIGEKVKNFGFCSQCKRAKIITPFYYLADNETIMLLCGLHRR